MEFNSLIFIFLLFPVYIILMFLVKNNTFRNMYTMVYSLMFYYFGNIDYFILLLLMIMITYCFGLLMNKPNNRVYYIIYLVIVVFTLSFFKYGNYFINGMLSFLRDYKIEKIIMPLGVSFYTFTSISYVSDCYYKKIKASTSLLDIASYISFFPTIVSGPIIRFADFKGFLEEKTISYDSIANGIRRFSIGLFKKVIISNQLGIIVTTLFDNNADLSFPLAWLGAICFMLQLYYDFSSYSDMAIAVASMVGFRIPENFDDPYMSVSIKEFWRRWHISLGSWFRDYVYIPLGGNRVSSIRWIINTMIVWLLTGIWHGSTFGYVAWGLYNGILLIGYKYLGGKIKLPKIISWIITQGCVMFGFLIFRVNSFTQLKQFIKGMIGRGPAIDLFYIKFLDIHYLWFYIMIAVVFIFPFFKNMLKRFEQKMPYIYDILVVILLFVSVVYIVSGSYSSFIYAGF